ncbi:hypothetical protein BT96DRAFT_449168 [Gymnopus androsaceus JB14]|uniref:Uncharacterized protein n=1 Tax=Gymnopus androsaceus JB14 TaxID=1447944 RepID=A0A6A4GQG4_9AGAR|nr:hypothetical protein BT96DRAFT_449168 [Gymnopus androsaceus JB14]
MSRERPTGSQNEAGHLAGGTREGAGRPSNARNHTHSNLNFTMFSGNDIPGAAFQGSSGRMASVFDTQLSKEKKQTEEESSASSHVHGDANSVRAEPI